MMEKKMETTMQGLGSKLLKMGCIGDYIGDDLWGH